MARDFSEMGANAANLIAILGGGACYWFCVIRPNAADEWLPQVFGTLTANSFDPLLYEVPILTNRLISVGDIDNAIDPYKGPLAFCPDVQVQIQNVLADIDFSIYQGRVLEIRLGYGASMTIATSTIMFTGRIVDSKVELHKITFTARGKSQLADKPVGVPLPDDVDDKYKGKIYPMTWGDWTDENAYAPVVLNRSIKKLADLVFDTEPWKSFQDLRAYDDKLKIGFRAKTSANNVVSSDNNKLSIVTDTAATLLSNVSMNQSNIVSAGWAGIAALYGTDYSAKPMILKIDDELMLIIQIPTTSTIWVERGYFGSTVADHAAGTKIYLYDNEYSTFKISVTHLFKFDSIGGGRIVENWDRGGTLNVLLPTSPTKFENILKEIGDYFQADIQKNGTTWSINFTEDFIYRINLDVGDIGLSGDVVSQYLIFKGYARSESTKFYSDAPGGKSETIINLLKQDANAVEILHPKAVWGDLVDEDDFDNMSDSPTDGEMDLELTGGSKIEDVADLNNAGYSLEIHCAFVKIDDTGASKHLAKIYGIGMLLIFQLSPLEFDFWARGKGRKNPGGYFNGDAGDLMENPSSVIEDFCKTADAGSPIISLTEAGFDEAYTARAAWKLAHTVYAKENDRPKFRDELEKMLECSGLVCFEKYDGTFSIATLDAPVAVTRNIAASEVKVDGQKRAQIKYSYLPAEMLITSIEVKYAPILPEDGKYAGRFYTSRTEATDSDSECMGYMQQAYETLGEERPLIIEAPAIRDATTAAALAKLIMKLRYKSLVKVEINGTYKLLNIELLDKIGLSGLGFLPVAIEGKTFIVTGHRIQPHVNGEEPDVRIVLTELGTATIEEALVWIEEGAGAAEKIEVGSAAVNKFYEVGTL